MKDQPASPLFHLQVKSDLRAGAIVCFDNSSGYLMPVWTPCSTGYNPAPTPTPPNQGTQWLDCKSCRGTIVGPGQIQDASCQVCYTL
mgnify:FL=1|jgi:hypothetical protein